jgi:hypothetical protein
MNVKSRHGEIHLRALFKKECHTAKIDRTVLIEFYSNTFHWLMVGDEDVCFGLPRPWFMPFVGVAIILIGIFGLLGELIPNMPSVWPLILIIFGALIIVAAIYRPRR